MRIALDFDGTYTAAPEAWRAFCRLMADRGHEVKIVTARAEFADGINWQKVGGRPYVMDIIWCDGVPKRQVCRDRNWSPDIWIDDDPYSLINGSQFTPEALAAWRKEDTYGNRQPKDSIPRHDDGGEPQSLVGGVSGVSKHRW